MMNRVLRTLLLFVAIVLPLIASAQFTSAGSGPVEEHVKWSASMDASAAPSSATTVTLKAEITKGWHLYGLKPIEGGPISTKIEAGEGLTLKGAVTSSKTIQKHDPNFDLDVEFFEDEATFQVPVQLGPDIQKGALKVTFQACNDHTCDQPKTVEVPLTGGEAKAVVLKGDVDDAKAKGMLSFIAFAFTAGLLALLTPCVFPMVPITVSFFSKRRENMGPRVGMIHAAAYCGGIIGAFTGVGLLVTILFGASGIQKFATNPWVNIVLAVIFVLLALNLFGMLQLSLPSKVTNAFSPQSKSGILAPILMGLTFTLTSFTCTVPFVGTILVSAANGDIVYPLVGMLAFSTAFALPFFLLALFPQYLARLPKSGSWLEMMKAFMGFLEIAAAIKFISNADLVFGTGLISRSTFLVIWGIILLGSVVFLSALFQLPIKVDLPKKMGKGRMLTVALTSATIVWLFFGAFGGNLGALEAFLPPGEAKGWTLDYQRALQIARRDKKPMLIDFTGVTCTNCRLMEKNMFPRPAVEAKFKGYVLTKLYTDRPQDADNQERLQKLTGAVTLPAYVVLSPDEKVLRVFEGSTWDESEYLKFLAPSATGSAGAVAER